MNPFEDEESVYQVLRNEEGQHSLWPANIPVPRGWAMVHSGDSRRACIGYIEEHWTDMRPVSLVKYHEDQRS